ncbi:hypothetical protein QAD02_006167 [Eretmocerus hayati]|uniref:Uncharacterized protein n=1 Tax=Eretmocerus hayati TaxID=131215 RepID=A0ACC2N080_9HYME|nr:hypothetical protein QAD02_006167 [Eretmocerus hayati]
MRFFHELISVLCFLLFTNEALTTSTSTLTHRNASRTWSDKNLDAVWFHDPELVKDDGSFLYANCTVKNTRQSQPYHAVRTYPTNCDCHVTLDPSIFQSNSASSPIKCDVNLTAHPGQSMNYLGDFEFHRLGYEIALFSWQESPLVRLALVNVTNNCTTKLIEYPLVRDKLGLFHYSIKVYKDTFDFTVSNGMCGTGKCTMRYDFQGDAVDSRKKLLSVNNGPINGNSLGVEYIDANGEKRNLTETIYGAYGRRFAHDYEMLGLCWTFFNKTTHACMQFDQNGNMKVNQTLYLEDGQEIQSVHNLAEGGLVLLVSPPHQVKEDLHEDKLGRNEFQVIKILDGQVQEFFGITWEEYRSYKHECFHFEKRYRERDGEACFYFACSQYSKIRLTLKESCIVTK